MPSLGPGDRAMLLGPLPSPCLTCGETVIRNYCRACDEFFLLCACTRGGKTHGHEGHRVYRNLEPPEPVEMHGHEAWCHYCNSFTVKMTRNPQTLALQPDNCYCLMCAQPYYVVISEPIDEWERKQWHEKALRQAS